jgi:hypothetical protein
MQAFQSLTMYTLFNSVGIAIIVSLVLTLAK